MGSNHNIQNDPAVNNAIIGTEQQHGTQPPPTFKGLTDTLTRKKSPTAASVSDLVKQNNISMHILSAIYFVKVDDREDICH